MTALAAQNLASMDFLQPDEEMDLASSPARPTEDVDLDLGDLRDPSPYPLPDLMSEDQQKLTADGTAVASNNKTDPADENMFDDDLVDLEETGETGETGMKAAAAGSQDKQTPAFEEDDFLYEDGEEETKILVDTGVAGDGQEAEAELVFEEEVKDPASKAEIIDTSAAQNESKDPLEQSITTADASDPTLYPLKENSAKDCGDTAGEADPSGLLSDAAQEDLDASTLLQQDSAVEARVSSHPVPETQAPENGSHHSPSDRPALHPVKVQYQGSEMGLFPPFENDDTDVYFLHDISLAYQSLDKMLAACRDALEGSLGHDDELVLDVPLLALHISEGSRHAAQLSLSEILDVYVLLGQNENLEHMAPLQCNLSSRVCLASQYAYMHSSAQEGRTLAAYVEENGEIVEENEVGFSQDNEGEVEATSLPEQNGDGYEDATIQPEDDYTQVDVLDDPSQTLSNEHQDGVAEVVPDTAEDALDLELPETGEDVAQTSEAELGVPTRSPTSPAAGNLPPVEEVTSPTNPDPAYTAAADDDQIQEELANEGLEDSSVAVETVNGQNGFSEAREAEPDLVDEAFDDAIGTYEIDGEADSGTYPQVDLVGGEDDDPVALEDDALNVDQVGAVQADNYEGSANAETGLEADGSLNLPKPVLEEDGTVKQPETYDDDLLDFDSDEEGAKQPEKPSNLLSGATNGTNGDAERPSTPASVKKRKVGAVQEEDDDYGLWELDTPDKKRGRPS